MKTIGIDIGSMNVKAIVLEDSGIIGTGIGPPGDDVEAGARSVLESAVNRAGISLDSLPVVATGVGARLVSFTSQHKAITTCLSRGIHHLYPSVRLVIDMGAESTTVIKVNERGRLADWANHDKCASGTGLFTADGQADEYADGGDGCSLLAGRSTGRCHQYLRCFCRIRGYFSCSPRSADANAGYCGRYLLLHCQSCYVTV